MRRPCRFEGMKCEFPGTSPGVRDVVEERGTFKSSDLFMYAGNQLANDEKRKQHSDKGDTFHFGPASDINVTIGVLNI